MNAGWVAAIATAATAAGLFLIWLIRLLWSTLRRTIQFLDDFFGQPGHAGVPATPGVMARLAAVEALGRKIAAETEPNGGTSLRDVVHRIAEDLADVKDDQARLRTQIELRQPGGT